jgi:hypothetical protein
MLCLSAAGVQAQAPPVVLPTPGQIQTGQSSAKIKITKLADLPPQTYAVSGKAADFVKNDAQVAALAHQVEADVQHDLSTYDIQDPTTLRGLYGTLAATAMLRRDYPTALLDIQQVRNYTDKPQEKLTSGLTLQALIIALQSPNGDFSKTLESNLQTELTALPYDQVQDSLKSSKGTYEIITEPLLLGGLSAGVDPVMQTGTISQGVADGLLSAAFAERYILPNKAALLAAYTNVIEQHKTVAKPNIWPARDITLTPSSSPLSPKLHPVLVGIWDSGVDLNLYPSHSWTDTNGTHGIAFTLHSDPSSSLIYPLPAADQKYKNYLKGFEDLQANVDSPDAAAVRAKLATLSQSQVKPFIEGLGQYGNYAHGTHVTGIALRGNPAAHVVVCRITFDYHLVPEKPTVAQAKKDADATVTAVHYFKQHGVRVVNMSWGGDLASIDTALEQNKFTGTPTERRALAKKIYQIGYSELYNAMKADPTTLYCIAAGNSDNDVEFSDVFPSSFKLPNVLVVGAVDQAGDQTSFTSFGNVDIYSDGFEVNSYIPGGDHARLSGTSMAAPQVTNLAAKLFAVKPSLTVAQAKAIIISTSDARQIGNKTVRLIDPKKAVMAAERK